MKFISLVFVDLMASIEVTSSHAETSKCGFASRFGNVNFRQDDLSGLENGFHRQIIQHRRQRIIVFSWFIPFIRFTPNLKGGFKRLQRLFVVLHTRASV